MVCDQGSRESDMLYCPQIEVRTVKYSVLPPVEDLSAVLIFHLSDEVPDFCRNASMFYSMNVRVLG